MEWSAFTMQAARLNMGTTTAIEGKGEEMDMELGGALWEMKHRLVEGLLNPNLPLDRYSVARYGEGPIGGEKSRKTEEIHGQKRVCLPKKEDSESQGFRYRAINIRLR